jgi:hypothetical protein
MVLVEDLFCLYGEHYYVGHVTSHSKIWVDLETAELILLEFNSGVF